MGSPSGPSQQSTERGERKNNRVKVSESPCVQCHKNYYEESWNSAERLTFHTATACLENIGVHFHSRLREQLVSCQVGVVWGGNEVVTQRLCHVLVHLIVLRVEDITCRTPHEVGKTWRKCQTSCVIFVYVCSYHVRSRWLLWCYRYKFPIPSIPSTIRCRFWGHGSNLATMSTRCSLARPRICNWNNIRNVIYNSADPIKQIWTFQKWCRLLVTGWTIYLSIFVYHGLTSANQFFSFDLPNALQHLRQLLYEDYCFWINSHFSRCHPM